MLLPASAFVAVLTGEDYEHRHDRLNDLRKIFEKTFANSRAEPWDRYSASLGLSEYTPTDESAESVFKRADSLMYDAKKAFKTKHSLIPD